MNGMGDVRKLLKENKIKDAVEVALKMENTILKLEVLAYILRSVDNRDYQEFIFSQMFEAAESMDNLQDKAVAYAILAYSAYIMGKGKVDESLFQKALDLAKSLPYHSWRAETLADIAYYMAKADLFEESLRTFLLAYNTIRDSKEPYSIVVSVLSNIAKRLVRVGDSISNRVAVQFYNLAKEIYLSIRFRTQAKLVDEKIKFVQKVLKQKNLAVLEFLGQGDIDKAIASIRYLEPKERTLALLEISHWLFLHEKEKLARRILSDAFEMMLTGKFKPDDRELVKIAQKFIRIGLFDDALILAKIIEDKEKASEVLGNIALAYARFGKKEKALSIAEGIQNEIVKNKVLKALKGEEDVGHK